MTRRIRSSLALALGIAAAAWSMPATAADEARGRELYQLCVQCHTETGGGSTLALAPSIAGLPQWYVERQLFNFRDGVRGSHFDDITGMRMRPMARLLKTDDDLRAVAAHVAAMPVQKPAPTLAGGDASRGAQLFGPCTACHGADGAGNQQLNAPPINHGSDWYLLTQLKHFKAGIRGANPADVNGKLMMPMASLLADEQAMKDVIAHVMTLGK